jgi:hypothetical protein
MTRISSLIISLIISFFGASAAFAGNLIEREGAYEINWSSGKIRFYGVGKLREGEKNLRAAEQRAWADGLKIAEKNIPLIMSSRLGVMPQNAPSQLAKLAQSTTSVSTTYFGDQRIKVILESPISTVLPQLLGQASLAPTTGEPVGFILKASGTVRPSAALRIIDEKGRDMANIPVPRWFKGKTAPGDVGLAADAPVISGTMTGQGVLRVASSDWRNGYAAAMASGKAAVLVQ